MLLKACVSTALSAHLPLRLAALRVWLVPLGRILAQLPQIVARFVISASTLLLLARVSVYHALLDPSQQLRVSQLVPTVWLELLPAHLHLAYAPPALRDSMRQHRVLVFALFVPWERIKTLPLLPSASAVRLASTETLLQASHVPIVSPERIRQRKVTLRACSVIKVTISPRPVSPNALLVH